LKQNKAKHLSNQTVIQYKQVISTCREIFIKKHSDYGSSWRIMRTSSLVDQILIKAQRIRTLEEKGTAKVDEGIESEFMGIINYCIMGLIQENDSFKSVSDPQAETLLNWYDQQTESSLTLMLDKNHDYGEIWRQMLVSTFTDMLLMRVQRIHQIIQNQGKTIASEGVDSNLMDMINYSVFALIKLSEQTKDKP
jgi:hypothetical protein